MHGWGLAGLVCLEILSVQGDLAAQVETDANIATVRGLTSQTFTKATLSGRHSRVGIAV
jgi:hypothetical protein